MSHVLSFLGAFLIAKAVLLARERQVARARLFAGAACLLAALQQAIQSEVTLTGWIATVFGLVGLAWLGLKFGEWLADRDVRDRS